jgi:hypothetical protein
MMKRKGTMSTRAVTTFTCLSLFCAILWPAESRASKLTATVSNLAVASLSCQGAGVDIELCVVPGLREGTFLVQDGKDGTTIVSIPTDPSSCSDQKFEVMLEYPTTKPDGSVQREQRSAPVLSVRASASTCAKAAPSRELRLERSEVRYGLGSKDLAEMTYAPSPASIGALSPIAQNAALDIGLAFVRPKVAVDSLTLLGGRDLIVAGNPCGKARRRAKCMASYARALANPTPYGRRSCGRCPVAPVPLALVFTRRDEVRTVTDLKGFLGPIDTAADARLMRDATAVAMDGAAWLAVRSEIDGTCDPFERADVYERIQRDGRVDPIARLLVSRRFGVCA